MVNISNTIKMRILALLFFAFSIDTNLHAAINCANTATQMFTSLANMVAQTTLAYSKCYPKPVSGCTPQATTALGAAWWAFNNICYFFCSCPADNPYLNNNNLFCTLWGNNDPGKQPIQEVPVGPAMPAGNVKVGPGAKIVLE